MRLGFQKVGSAKTSKRIRSNICPASLRLAPSPLRTTSRAAPSQAASMLETKGTTGSPLSGHSLMTEPSRGSYQLKYIPLAVWCSIRFSVRSVCRMRRLASPGVMIRRSRATRVDQR